jgi:serine protease Do
LHRCSTAILCFGALGLGIGLGSAADWWPLSQPVEANNLDSATAERLYSELRAGNSPLLASSEYLSKIAKLTTSSVVHIQSERRSSRGRVEETGSGVIIQSEKSPGFFVATNRHVVDSTELNNISVHLHDGRVIHPTRIWTDKHTDVAVMKIAVDQLHPARWGDSQKLEIGHIVLAMGSPFGLSQSITLGIISAKGRRSLELGNGSEVINQDFLQTDAAINPGNSGGPLINLMGEVVGINTAIASNSGGNEGIGFSIPSTLARRVIDQLLEFGKVTRAYLGVKLDPDFNANTASRLKIDRLRGARVLEVYPNTPASRANLVFDDVVLYFDGVEIHDENHLINLVSLTPVNKTVKLVVVRGGKRISLEITLVDREELKQQAKVSSQPGMGVQVEALGLTVHQLDPEVAQQLGFPKSTTGLLVLKVDPKGPTAGQIQIYDLIEEVARTPVSSVEDLQQLVTDSGSETCLLKVQRNTESRLESHLVLVPR